MFISVPFDELLHIIIISGFQVGVGDDGVILQLTLKPLQRSWVWLVHVVSQHRVLTSQGPSTTGVWGVGRKGHKCAERMQQHLEKRVLGGQRTTAQKLHLGWREEEQMTRQHLKIHFRRNPLCLHRTRCVSCWTCHHCWIYFQYAECEQVMKCSVTECTVCKVMEALLNMGWRKQLEQPSKIPKDWPAAWIKEVLRRSTEGPWKLGKGCCRLKAVTGLDYC